jgi:hypothetical protein
VLDRSSSLVGKVSRNAPHAQPAKGVRYRTWPQSRHVARLSGWAKRVRGVMSFTFTFFLKKINYNYSHSTGQEGFLFYEM